jgi:hypothetical protein
MSSSIAVRTHHSTALQLQWDAQIHRLGSMRTSLRWLLEWPRASLLFRSCASSNPRAPSPPAKSHVDVRACPSAAAPLPCRASRVNRLAVSAATAQAPQTVKVILQGRKLPVRPLNAAIGPSRALWQEEALGGRDSGDRDPPRQRVACTPHPLIPSPAVRTTAGPRCTHHLSPGL